MLRLIFYIESSFCFCKGTPCIARGPPAPLSSCLGSLPLGRRSQDLEMRMRNGLGRFFRQFYMAALAINDNFYGGVGKLYGWDRLADSRSTGSRDG